MGTLIKDMRAKIQETRQNTINQHVIVKIVIILPGVLPPAIHITPIQDYK